MGFLKAVVVKCTGSFNFFFNKLNAVFTVFFLLFFNFSLYSQDHIYDYGDDMLSIEGFPLIIQVEGYGSFTSDALYFMPEGLVYVSIKELFDFLKIACYQSDDGNVLTGFIEYENNSYSIDLLNNQIEYKNRVAVLESGLIDHMGVAFMETTLFDVYFGIQLNFNFRSLSINVTSKFELPVVKQMRLEKIRSNLSKMRGEIIADTTIGRKYHLLRFGNVDWSFQSAQVAGGKSNTRLFLATGGELLHGEARIAMNYITDFPFSSRNLSYLWRWSDNDKKLVKQVHLGKIHSQSISSIFSPVIGFSLTNTPLGIRKAEGYYTINEKTEPNWVVELYINNNLLDHTVADASGLFTFQIPIVYGYSDIELRFYGPMGEEQSIHRNINMPYTFTPVGRLEYRITGGMLEDASNASFFRDEFSYGLSRRMTVGGGLEYLSSIETGQYIPFVSTSFLPVNKMVIKGEYAHGVRAKALMNYYFFNNALLEIDYTKYVEGQKAIRYNELSDGRIMLSYPYRFRNISGFSRVSFKKKSFLNFDFNVFDVSFSAYYRRLNASVFTGVNWISDLQPYAFSNLDLSYRLKRSLRIKSNIQYSYRIGGFSILRGEIEKRMSRNGYFSLSYERNMVNNYNALNVIFRYNLPFARTNLSSIISNKDLVTIQGAQGSLSFGSGGSFVHSCNSFSVGRGGITIFPFLDINHNGVHDSGEPVLDRLPVKISGGRVIYREQDSLTRVVGLEPFVNYLIEIDDGNLENISWRLKHKKIEVTVDPNQFKKIKIPVAPMGEVFGNVKRMDIQSISGIGRILISVFDEYGNIAAHTLTEPDGYFSYMNLKPGKYSVKIDDEQLRRLGYQSMPLAFNIELEPLLEGDIVGPLDFIIEKFIHEHEVAALFYKRGVEKLENGNYEGAIIDFNKAVEINPGSAELSLYRRGFAYAKLGNFDDAILDFNNAINIISLLKDYPAYVAYVDRFIYFERGNVKYKMGDIEGACNDWKQADKLGYDEANEFIDMICN